VSGIGCQVSACDLNPTPDTRHPTPRIYGKAANDQEESFQEKGKEEHSEWNRSHSSYVQ
jgi:hypothetical protein